MNFSHALVLANYHETWEMWLSAWMPALASMKIEEFYD